MLSVRIDSSPPESLINEPMRSPRRVGLPPQDPYAQTTVILQDASYEHKYSRPRTSAAELANIVERPERLAAAVMGVCALQVRAGRGMVSMVKTSRTGGLVDDEVTLVHAHTPAAGGKGKAWPEELADLCEGAGEKLKRGEVEIPKPYHAGDLYLSAGSKRALEGCLGAVYEGVDRVMTGGDEGHVRRAFVCIRPPGKFRYLLTTRGQKETYMRRSPLW